MSTILGILAAVVFIVWGMFRKEQKVATSVLVRRYYHPGHTWTRVTDDGDVLVGIDDFAQSVLGRVDAVQLPRFLHRVRQGRPALRASHANRSVPFVSPVTGRVIEKNEMVLRNPSLVNTAPYGDGWLLRIRPSRLNVEVNNLFTGRTAQQFLQQAKEQLVRLFSGTPALLYQDGGVIIDNLSDRVSDEEWNTILQEMFLVQEPDQRTIPQW